MVFFLLMLGLGGCVQTVQTLKKPAATDSVVLADGVKLELIHIPAGTFQMGSPEAEPGRSKNEGPVHKVIISKSFWMGKYEVTQAQWKAIMGNNPSHFKGDNFPVETVSWNDCQEFIQKLNAKTGKHFRLPTEAEWEYACRAGTDTAYSYGSDPGELCRYGNYCDNYCNQQWLDERHKDGYMFTSPAGNYEPNPWGLYDMHGNVYEWCSDWYRRGPFDTKAVTDPVGPEIGDFRVIRGGSWANEARDCRSARRAKNAPYTHFNMLGFRVVRETNGGSI